MSRFEVGDEVVSLANDVAFRVAGIDEDCVLRAEDGAWLHEDDVTLACETAPFARNADELGEWAL
jgi:hypothetical protein